MNPREELVELAATPGASVVAFDPWAITAVALPPELGLGAAAVVDAESPLELIDPVSRAAAVVAFEQARRSGRSTVVVQLVGSPAPMRLRLFDLSEHHDVFVGVMTPDELDPEPPSESVSLPARRATFRQTLGGVIESIDESCTELLGWDPDDVIGESTLTLVHPDDHEAALIGWADVLRPDAGSVRVRQRLRRRDGSWLWCDASDRRDDSDPTRVRVVCELTDVSREIEALAALQRRETMLDRLYRALPTSVMVLEIDGTVAVHNERWTDFFGEHELGPYHAMLDRCTSRDRIVGAIDRAIVALDDVDVSFDVDDGSCRHGDLHVRPLVERGVHVGTLLTVDETTARRHHADDLAEQMRRDPLTGTHNRLGVREHIERRLSSDAELAVLYVDLDGFKAVNDTHGHQVGDQVLRAAAAGIVAATADGDVVARVGGDEFVVVLDPSSEDIESLTAKLSEQILAHTSAIDPTTGLDASIGVAARIEGDDFDSLIDRADRTMYAEKDRRRLHALGRELRHGGAVDLVRH